MASRMMKRASIWPASPTRIRKAIFLIALAGAAPGIAHAQDSGNSEGSLWGSMLKGLGIGGDNNIEYRERPPLVVPQTRDLPPPQAGGSVRNPDWPADPKSADLGKRGAQVRDLDKIPPQVGANPAGDAAPPSPPAGSRSLFGKLFSSSDNTAAVPPTPTRKSLTEPPLDYESPSPSQPYGTTSTPTRAKPASPEAALAPAPGAGGQ